MGLLLAEQLAIGELLRLPGLGSSSHLCVLHEEISITLLRGVPRGSTQSIYKQLKRGEGKKEGILQDSASSTTHLALQSSQTYISAILGHSSTCQLPDLLPVHLGSSTVIFSIGICGGTAVLAEESSLKREEYSVS